jgi:alpha-tubulin suppressor-like RCC1 family protein
MITYLIYLKELDESSKKTSILAESNHNHFNGQFTGRLSYDSFKAFKLKLSDSTEIEKYASVAFSSDAAGKNILCNKYKQDFTKDVEINSSTVYVHYPYRQPKIIAFGDYSKGKLGLTKTEGQTEEPVIIDDMYDPIVDIKSVEHYTVILDENGKLWKSGDKNSMGGQDNTFRLVDIAKVAQEDKEKKEGEEKDKIVKIAVGTNNTVLLTKKGRIFFEGEDIGNHYGSGSQ